MTDTWTLTGELGDFGLDPVPGATLVVEHDPPVWPDEDGDRLLVLGERARFDAAGVLVDDDGEPGLTLAVTGGHYRFRTSPRSLFGLFTIPPEAQGGTRSLHDLYVAHHGVPVPSPLVPRVRGASAYEVAVAAGYTGTEADWLASLVGTDGADSTVPGPANTLTIGTVTSGSTASATITGTSPSQTLDLVLPKGDTGPPAGPHAATHAEGGTDPITPASIGAASIADVSGEFVEGGQSFPFGPGTEFPTGAVIVELVTAVGALSQMADGQNALLGEVVQWAQALRSGTGSPEGVVAAPVGTAYTDTAGTNGAWQWLKKSGTGTTGWAVTHSDGP